jgi:hypothetical protein
MMGQSLKNRVAGMAALMLAPSIAWAVICGGEGPGPMVEIPLHPTIQALETVGSVQELAYLEQSQTLVYRNQFHDLYAHTLEWGTNERLWEGLNAPLSQVLDAGERFLTTFGVPWVFDLSGRTWTPYGEGPGPMALFWTPPPENSLVAIESHVDSARSSFVIRRYNPDESLVERCTIYPPPGRDYHVVRGRTYPYVHFYYERAGAGQRSIHFLRYDTHCKQYPGSELGLEIPSPLEEVYQYGADGPTLLKLDDPQKNVILQEGRACSVFDIGNRHPLFVHDSKPVIATWAPQSGLLLFFLDAKQGKVGKIKLGDCTRNVSADRVWMTRDESQLFVAPDTATFRSLLKIELHRK